MYYVRRIKREMYTESEFAKRRAEVLKFISVCFDLTLKDECGEAACGQFRDLISIENSVGSFEYFEAFDEKGHTAGALVTDSTLSHVVLLFTKPVLRNKGIGSSLLDTLCAETNSIGISVNAFPASTEFYEKAGFVKTGELTDGAFTLIKMYKNLKKRV